MEWRFACFEDWEMMQQMQRRTNKRTLTKIRNERINGEVYVRVYDKKSQEQHSFKRYVPYFSLFPFARSDVGARQF